MTTVGVIGLGRMGLPIAENLMERGFAVVGYRRSPAREAAEKGIVLADSPADVAARSDVLLSIVPDIAAVRDIVEGPAGVLQGLRRGTVHIEMSTVDVTEKAQVRDRVRAAGGDLLDAPISGSANMVRPRLATTFASGDDASIEAARTVLDAVSGPWVRAGAFGAGAHLKYVANLLLAVHTVAAAEALALARRSGLDLDVVQASLDGSIAGSTVWTRFGPRMRRRAYLPAPGPIATLHDILVQIDRYRDEVGATTPMFDVAKQLFDEAVAQGFGHLDVSFVHDQLAGGPPADGFSENASTEGKT
ncbi:NAD(P)-dependent oxidoreductase [Amycolatopsis sp. cmx-4-68]|uniref:NAD(P)-dependent oxidoreductase n=1 Tax=Amycolatopsis sp. cmx-4-68 TaxID=2790938 RepID=UPI003978FB12